MGCQGKDSGKWAKRYDCCRACGTTERPHRARGFCRPCYHVDYEARIRNSPGSGRIGRGHPSLRSQIPKPLMEKLYYERKLSLQDIAVRYGCSRVLVYYLMKDYGIPRRSHSTARRLAQRAGKIRYTMRLQNGELRSVTHPGTNIDPTFFRQWSPEMAYVLGVFYSDGCLTVTARGYRIASISQKEPELLEKCLVLMLCDARIDYGHQKDGSPRYTFVINDQDVCRDLVAHGLHPRKSRTIRFPELPGDLIRHFIRGCWDGDGSIYRCKRIGSPWAASYVSSSHAFVTKLRDALVQIGMPTAKVCSYGEPSSFSIRYSGPRCQLLYRILYDDVPRSQYLTRKYVRFRAAAALSEPPAERR